MDDYGRMTRNEKRDGPQVKTIVRFKVRSRANVLARTMFRLSTRSLGHPFTPHPPTVSMMEPWAPAVREPTAISSVTSSGHDPFVKLSRTSGTQMLVLRHDSHLLPGAIRTSRTPRPTIRCRQPTPRNAAEKAPPCNFARLATDLDIPKTIRQQRVECDVRLQVTDLQDSLRRNPCSAEDVQLFHMSQYMPRLMVLPMRSSYIEAWPGRPTTTG